MAVTTTNIQNVAYGTGAATQFPFSFRFTSIDQIAVTRAVNGGPDPAVVVSPSEYFVVPGAGNVGGYVQFTTGAPAVGLVITIVRGLPLIQPTVIVNQDGFFPQVVTDALDRGVMIDQQLSAGVNASLRIPDAGGTVLPSAINRAGRLVGFDDQGNVIVTTTVPDLDIPVDVATAAAETAVQAAQAAVAARTAVEATAPDAIAAANIALPAAIMAQNLANNFSEVVGPVTGTAISFFNGGSPYDLGDVLPVGAPFANERLASVRIDLARGTGAIIDMGSVA